MTSWSAVWLIRATSIEIVLDGLLMKTFSVMSVMNFDVI